MENAYTKELVCIGCPLGCNLTVYISNTSDAKRDDSNYERTEKITENDIMVEGNTCPKGASYAKKELTNPTRIVTSTVRVTGGKLPQVSCKTEKDIPKSEIMNCMKALSCITVSAPVHIGDVITENVADTGVCVVATKEVLAQ